MPLSRSLVPALAALAVGPLVSASLAAMDSNDVQIHGFVSQGYLRTTENNIYGTNTTDGTFDFNEVGVNFTATPIDRLRVGVQIFAQNLGAYGKGKPQIDWGYGEYELNTGSSDLTASVSAGRVKTGLGFYSDYRDLDMTRTNVFLPDSVYSTSYRDFQVAVNGAAVNGAWSGRLGALRGNAYFGGQTVDSDGAIADRYTAAATVSTVDNITVRSAGGGGLEWNTPMEGLRFKGSALSVSHMVADVTSSAGEQLAPGIRVSGDQSWKIDLTNYVNWIVGAEYQVGNFTLASEYSNQYYSVDINTPTYITNVGPIPVPATHVSNRTQGAYLNGSYRFHPKWEGSLMGTWSYSNDYAGAGDLVANFKRAAVLALRFDPTEHWLIKAEFQRNRGTLGVYGQDNPNGTSEYWNLFTVKTTYDF